LFYLGLIPGIDTAFVNKQGKATSSVEIDPHLPEQRIGRVSQVAHQRTHPTTLNQPAPGYRFPQPAGALHQSVQVMRAAHWHEGAQRAEFSRANAGWQVHGRSAY
jgi:hypothetical protein